MNQSLGWQMDYIYFLYGLSFIMLAAVCLAMSRAEKQRLPWIFLSLFGIAHGLYEWLYHFSASEALRLSFSYLKAGLLIIALLCLTEFGRDVFIKVGVKSPGRRILILLSALVAPGVLYGPAGLAATTQYVLGLGGGLWAALALHLASRKINKQARRWLESGSVAIALFAVTAVLSVPPSPLFPANLINYHVLHQTLGLHIQVMRGLFIVWTTVAVWGYSQEIICAETGRDFQSVRAKYAVRFVVILLFILGLGLAATSYLSRNARMELMNESVNNINALANHLQDQMKETEHAVMSIAASPEVLPALLDGGEENVARANFILDRFNEALDAPICYLLDEKGKVISSTNRNDSDSYVGHNYEFRPYFQQAISGNTGRYYALGVTSGERGYYVSYPVVSGGVIGVAVIKRKIDSVELGFKQYPYCFYIDPQGIVFLSSRPEWLYKSLWPLEEGIQKKLIESRQFGAGPFETMSLQEVANGVDVVYDGQRFLVNRKQVSPEGWSIVLFAPLDKTRPAGLLGIVITFCLSLLTISFFVTTQRLTESAIQTETSEENYHSIFNGVNEGIFVHELTTWKIIDVNQKMCEMFGCTREEAVNGQLELFVAGKPPYTIKDIGLLLKKATCGEPQLFEWLSKDTAGRLFWTEINLKKALIGGKECILAVVRDITVRKKAEEALRESEANYRTVFENTGTALAIFEEDTSISLSNTEFSRLSGYPRVAIEGKKSWTEFVSKEELEKMLEYHYARRVNRYAAPSAYECKFIKSDGEIRDVLLTVALIPGTKKSVASFLDITERKRAEEQLKYLSLHDSLTSLYNRAFFEEEMRRLEGKRDTRVGMLVCDIDGLKLVNDTLGHEAGDRLLIETARIIRECFREGDMIARIGGDEFAVLLPDCDEIVIDRASQRIKEEIEKHNAGGAVPPLSMSIGLSMSGKTKGSLKEVFKEADNNMYREKLHCGQSARSAIVQTLMKALEARDYLTEGHADRLQELVEELASAIGLPERGLADLRLLAKFHDIGKVGIPDRILFKPAPLTSDEYSEMKRHSEIGHRIAQSNPDLASIAGWILKHHEWWDGQGYPHGLKGEEIPLECRILAIADAYDAMTNDRPYRRVLSRDEAIAEIKKCAGTQFDPELVQVFLQVLQKRQ